MDRNLSIDAYFNRLAEKHRPQFRFDGATKSDWLKWREAPAPAVMQSLGTLPAKVPLRPEILAEWTEDELVKQKIVFDVEEGLSANAYVFRPQAATGKLPAIVCCHGHGLGGKEPVMGNGSTPELALHIKERNYDYGLQMARGGFVTVAIDWRGFGERDDRSKPHYHDLTNGAATFATCTTCASHPRHDGARDGRARRHAARSITSASRTSSMRSASA